MQQEKLTIRIDANIEVELLEGVTRLRSQDSSIEITNINALIQALREVQKERVRGW